MNMKIYFKMFYILIILYEMFNQCYTYRFLVVFPLPRTSHAILGSAYVKHLLKAGHEVTYITPMVLSESSPNLRQIDISSLKVQFPRGIINLKKFLSKERTFAKYFDDLAKSMYSIANATLLHKNVQGFIHDPNERFDAVIAEYMFSGLHSGFSSVFKCPLIWSVSMEPNQIYFHLIDGLHNPAYTYNFLSNTDPPFSFLQRVMELYRLISYKYIMWSLSDDENESYNRAFASAAMLRGQELPSFDEVRHNASLILGNSDVSLGHAMRLPAAYKQIAGYHIFDIPPLPKELQDIMDMSQDGVIYFSLGSVLNSVDLSDDIKSGILKVFANLNQTVIWKLEERLSNLPKNVHIVSWAPQQSILAHKQCKIIITHGGLLSLIESVHFGVPIIGMPVFADQFINIDRSVRKGFARRINLHGNPEVSKDLKIAIEDVLKNPRYKEKAKEYSMMYHHRVAPPGDELIHWVEHVVRTRGAPHLHSPMLEVPLYQRLYLDLMAFISVAVLFFIKVVNYIFKVVNKYINVKKKIE
ncbi:UDP-glucosyltransferase 2-like isoform 1-T1 [Aphomia sociella]